MHMFSISCFSLGHTKCITLTGDKFCLKCSSKIEFVNLFSPQGINIVEPSNAEPTPRPPSPAMYQLDIVLKKGNNLAIRDRTGRRLVSSPLSVPHPVMKCQLLDGQAEGLCEMSRKYPEAHRFMYFPCLLTKLSWNPV